MVGGSGSPSFDMVFQHIAWGNGFRLIYVWENRFIFLGYTYSSKSKVEIDLIKSTTQHPAKTNGYHVIKRSDHVITIQCGPNSASAVCRIMILQLSELERPRERTCYCTPHPIPR